MRGLVIDMQNKQNSRCDSWNRIYLDRMLPPHNYYAEYIGDDAIFKSSDEVQEAVWHDIARRCKALDKIEKCREVAKRLRDGKKDTAYMNDHEFLRWLYEIIGESDDGELLTQLADLIDPDTKLSTPSLRGYDDAHDDV